MDHQQADEARWPLTQQRAAAYSDCSSESLLFLSSPDTRVKPVQTALDSNFHMTTNEGVAIIGSLPIPAVYTAASVEIADIILLINNLLFIFGLSLVKSLLKQEDTRALVRLCE